MGSEVFHGIISCFYDLHGYGFISCPEAKAVYGEDVFLHALQFSGQGLSVNDHVSFTVTQNNKGKPQARNVCRLNDQILPDELFGEITCFYTDKGYGFIRCADSSTRDQDAFLHFLQFRGKQVGDTVAFTIKCNARGQRQAHNVRKVADSERSASISRAEAHTDQPIPTSSLSYLKEELGSALEEFAVTEASYLLKRMIACGASTEEPCIKRAKKLVQHEVERQVEFVETLVDCGQIPKAAEKLEFAVELAPDDSRVRALVQKCRSGHRAGAKVKEEDEGDRHDLPKVDFIPVKQEQGFE